jgi:dihydroorotate dehydrogenase electron transfer subunit
MTVSLPRPTHIVDITGESPRVRTLVLDLRLDAQPGQFVMAWLPGVDEKPFSLVRADPASLTVARVGPFTSALFALGSGDRLWIRGPLGQPFTLPAQPSLADGVPPGHQSKLKTLNSKLLLIAGGYGVAPLHFLAECALDAGWLASVVIGAQTAGDAIFADRFAALGARVTITTNDGSLGEPGLATDAADRLLAEGGHQALYACGPEPMLDAVEALARAHQVPAQLSYERYMRCGFGVCGSCAQEGWLACRDGPVRSI